MKFTVTIKANDGITYDSTLTQEEENQQRINIEKLCNRFTTYGEYIDLEFDTELLTATVVRQPQSRIDELDAKIETDEQIVARRAAAQERNRLQEEARKEKRRALKAAKKAYDEALAASKI